MFRQERTLAKKSVKNKYDPQIGAAAAKSAQIAEESLAFTKEYHEQYVAPMLAEMTRASQVTRGQQQELHDRNIAALDRATQEELTTGRASRDAYFAEVDKKVQQSEELYGAQRAAQDAAQANYKELAALGMGTARQGAEASGAFYDMAKNFNTDAEFERQANQAMGDVKVAAGNNQGAMQRQMASLGIRPDSPAAIAMAQDAAIQNGAIEAAAANKARDAARRMGMQLTADAANYARGETMGMAASGAMGSYNPQANLTAVGLRGDAANFGRGGQSAMLNFGQAAGANSQANFGIAAGALQGANSGAAVRQSGFGTGLQGYGQNLQAYTSLGNTSMQAQAQQNAAVTGAIGSAIGAGAGLAALKFG